MAKKKKAGKKKAGGKKKVSKKKVAASASTGAGGVSGDIVVEVSSAEPGVRNRELATALLDFLNPLPIRQISWSPADTAWRVTLRG